MIPIISEPILVSGPSVSEREVSYTADAARNGWNQHCFDYIHRFEKEACRYLGVAHALALSSCTGALHLAMLALGIGPGDEVILPEATWIATANAVEYVGATCVFADVEPDSWTISLDSLRKCVNERTKAIMVTHLYGHPCHMDVIMEFAHEHHLYVVEDAAQCLGGEISGKKVGAIADIGCFSFHGSKAALVMGEGGLLVTQNEELFARAKFLGDQGKHPTIRFYNVERGYKYKISNLQAAFGLGQLERIEEIIENKRQIFRWYQEFLADVPDISLNAELYGSKNTYWMPTIVLGSSYALDAAHVIDQLRDRKIESRPFFYPLSSLPMYQGQAHKDNPVAYRLHERALNLPCGAERQREEIEYVCAHIRDILQPGSVRGYVPRGWLEFRERALRLRSNCPITFQLTDYIKRRCFLDEISALTITEKDVHFLKEDIGFEHVAVSCRQSDAAHIARLAAIGFLETQSQPVGNLAALGIPCFGYTGITPFDKPEDTFIIMQA